jgi:hypothetical protein
LSVHTILLLDDALLSNGWLTMAADANAFRQGEPCHYQQR